MMKKVATILIILFIPLFSYSQVSENKARGIKFNVYGGVGYNYSKFRKGDLTDNFINLGENSFEFIGVSLDYPLNNRFGLSIEVQGNIYESHEKRRERIAGFLNDNYGDEYFIPDFSFKFDQDFNISGLIYFGGYYNIDLGKIKLIPRIQFGLTSIDIDLFGTNLKRIGENERISLSVRNKDMKRHLEPFTVILGLNTEIPISKKFYINCSVRGFYFDINTSFEINQENVFTESAFSRTTEYQDNILGLYSSLGIGYIFYRN